MDKSYLIEFRPTVDEFSIQQIHVKKSDLACGQEEFLLPKLDSGAILIVIESGQEGVFRVERGRVLECRVGLVYFIDANVEVSFCVGEKKSDSETVLLAYRAYCDIKA